MRIRSRPKRKEFDFRQAHDQRHLLHRFWQSAGDFWSGWRVRALIGLLIAVLLLQLLVQYWLNFWNRDFFNALERKDADAIWAQARLFGPLVAASLVLALLSVWGRMTAQRRWRAWLTKHLINYWLGNERYRRLNRIPGEPRYPEYRIADDARVATDAPIDLTLGLLTSVLNAITFISVLWSVGGDLQVQPFGVSLTLPAYLVIAVTGYSGFLAATMLFVGRRLAPVIEQKNEAEAALRSSACRLRELGESNVIRYEVSQHSGHLRSTLDKVIACWRDLCIQLVRTTIVGHVNVLFAPVLAWILCAPKYLTGMMALGEVVQVAAAFVMVQGALNWFVDNYHRLADWISSVNRVSVLLLALDRIDSQVMRLNSSIVGTANRNRARREHSAASSILLPDCTLPGPLRRPNA
jgi:vitamin B12/bleomycin/antimicrobial peptide transport system ATP-binding/permease protein